jgi:hypothetical protein
MEGGGEHGELTIELTASLARTRARVSAAEQRELRALLEATSMPTHLIGQLAVPARKPARAARPLRRRVREHAWRRVEATGPACHGRRRK